MQREFTDLLYDSLKVAIVAVITFQMTPWLEQTFPKAPVWLLFLVPAFVTAFLLLGAWTLLKSSARLHVSWRSAERPDIDLSQVIVDVASPSSPRSQTYFLKVQHQRSRALGVVALWIGSRVGLKIRVEVLHSKMTVAIGGVAGHADADAIPGNGCSVDIPLRPPVPDAERDWMMASVDFSGLGPHPTVRRTINCTPVARNPLAWLCGRLVKVDSSATTLDENWS